MRDRRRRVFTSIALVSLIAAAVASNAPAAPIVPQTAPTQEQKAGQTTAAPTPDTSNAKTTNKTATPASNPAADSRPASGPMVGVNQDDRHIVNADLITLTVTVTDTYGRFVTGLGQKAFTILDDKTEQEIAYFSDEDAPVSLGVIFDVSGSMSGEKIKKAREALARFVDTSHQGDEYFLIGFNSRAQLLLNKTRDSDAMLDKLTFVETKGMTALYDAAYLGVEKVTRGTHEKKAVLLISDGQDNSSRYTFSELKRLLKETDVIIYSVGIVTDGDDGTLGIGGRAILEELSGVSGGKAFFPSSAAELNDTFERIALELRTQYSIGYRPSNFANDGRWHKLKVRVQPPRGMSRLFVRAKEGYFAVTNPK
ncbi:MAG TPA: VWA domain-containing protein [Pyrinomonadaceae bacterium]